MLDNNTFFSGDIKKHFNDSCSCSKTQQPCETKAENTAYRSRYRQGGIDMNKNNLFNELDSMDIENILCCSVITYLRKNTATPIIALITTENLSAILYSNMLRK